MQRLRKFAKPILVTLLLMVGTGVLVAPSVNSYLGRQADRLVREAQTAETSSPQTAATRYEMAAFLRPGDHSILSRLAAMYVRLNQPDDAIAVLRRLPQDEAGDRIADLQFRSGQYDAALTTLNTLQAANPTTERLITKSKTLLELDRGDEALIVAKEASEHDAASLAAKQQLALCQLTGHDEAGYQATIASLGSVEAVGTLQTAHASVIALGRQLYVLGLLRTSERILNNTDSTSTERYLLLAKIKLAQNNLTEAKDQLVRATKLDPANIDAHKLLEEVLLQLNDESGAGEQAKLIKSLQTGQL